MKPATGNGIEWHPSWTQHGFWEMLRSRVFGILADYEDQNDHDRHGRFHSPREFQLSVCGW